jgi:hypothetical protein
MSISLLPILAQAVVGGDNAIQSILYLIVLGVIFGLLWWLVSYCALPAPFDKVARVVLAVAAVIVVINVLLSMVGHPLFRWH